MNKFNTSLADAQATAVEPVTPEQFDFDAYSDYEISLLDKCRRFWNDDSGVLVYRRMRVAPVFSYDANDMKKSLEWQLGALKKSVKYKSDIPNFLEPWYGIGTIASAYGAEYIWMNDQAPAVKPVFESVQKGLDFDPKPVAATEIGKHTLEMIAYFLDKTRGKLPISLTDTQSPLNCACNIVSISNFMMEVAISPQNVKNFLFRMADLLIELTREQIKLIGSNIVWPGHGFASSRAFSGVGMSDDNMLMISGQSYFDQVVPSVERFGETFGGPVFHSCGNWSDRIKWVKQIKGLKMVDGAFSGETDPEPNPFEPFDALANTDIVLNARIVGDINTITEAVKKLWKDGMKLIVVTYCKTSEEQDEVYNRIHQICQ